MRMSTKVIIVFFLLLGLVTGITLFLNMFDAYTFWGSMFYIIFMLVGGIVIYYWWLNRQKNEHETKTMEYCWNKSAEILQKMPDGVSVEWQQSFGRRSEVRFFSDGLKKYQYRAFKAMTAHTNQPVIFIFDVDREDVVRLDTNPSPQLFANPFYQFDPFNAKGMGMNPNFHRYGKNDKGRSLNIHWGDDGSEYPQQIPSDDFAGAANKAIDTLNR